jgi:hypothetical protein
MQTSSPQRREGAKKAQSKTNMNSQFNFPLRKLGVFAPLRLI